MLAYEKRPLLDQLNKQLDYLFDEWDKLPSIYDASNPTDARVYENIAGIINYIEKCKKMLMNPLWR